MCATTAPSRRGPPVHPIAPRAAGLQELRLSRSGVERVPPVLSSIAGLSRLVLDNIDKLELSEADMGVIMRMPSLQRLVLEETRVPARLVARLCRARPQLEVL